MNKPSKEWLDEQLVWAHDASLDPADIFSRTRFLTAELSAAILGAGTLSLGVERARTDCDLHSMELGCSEMGRLLAQALTMQMTLEKQINNLYLRRQCDQWLKFRDSEA